MREDFDAVIVGGGPAGLAAALWLGRYGRRVRVYDAGAPRNEPTRAVHGYPGLADLPPAALRQRLRAQAEVAGAEVRDGCVAAIEGDKDAFRLRLDDAEVGARRVLLAYGRHDVVPDVPGLMDAFGRLVFHCPDCDGPEVRGRRVGVIGWDVEAARVALYLCGWAHSMVLLTHGHRPDLTAPQAAVLARHAVEVRAARIERITAGDALDLAFADGERVTLDALFFHFGSHPGCDLAERLGCERDAEGHVRVDRKRETSVPGVFAAGDLVGLPYLAINAAAEGVHAALAMHRSLLPSDIDL
jgi:thioredoxin reductase